MDHHTAVHIVGGSSRALLGPHVWQAGSSKGSRFARIDLTHHSRLSREELNDIEDHANSIIEANTPVEKIVMQRAQADGEYGFEIYQGGPPKQEEIRVIRMGIMIHRPAVGRITTRLDKLVNYASFAPVKSKTG